MTGEEAKEEQKKGPAKPMTIRFEMMYNVRCLGCNNSIAKGVRFNAKKKSVGKYLSTKIYEFIMNCHLCGNKMVIRTDPEKGDYIMISGVERRIEDLSQIENAAVIETTSDQTKKGLESNAFFKLENVIAD